MANHGEIGIQEDIRFIETENRSVKILISNVLVALRMENANHSVTLMEKTRNDGNSSHVASTIDRIVNSMMTSVHVALTVNVSHFAVLTAKIRSNGNLNHVASTIDHIVNSTMTNVHVALTENVSHFAVLMVKILKDGSSSHVASINIDHIISFKNRMSVPLTIRQLTRI